MDDHSIRALPGRNGTFHGKHAPLMATIAQAYSLIATGWLRNFGDGSVSGPCVGLFLIVVAIGAALFHVVRTWQSPWVVKLVEVPLGGLLAALAAPYWVSQLGAYAVPHVPESIGIALCAAAFAAGILSLFRKERATTIAVMAIILSLFVEVTAFSYDPFFHTPYYTLRKFAAAAYHGDQRAARALYSSKSLRQFAEMPLYLSDGGAYPMGRTQACNSLLLDIRITGNRAIAQCPVPYRWTAMSVAGDLRHVYLIREGGQWKIDAYRDWQEEIARQNTRDEASQGTNR